MLRELGLEIDRFEEFVDWDIYESRNLKRGVFFDKETFGRDHLAMGRGELPWQEFLAQTPLSEAVRRDIVRLHTEREDYLKGRTLEEKRALLQKLSYAEYVVQVAKVDPGVIPYLQSRLGYWAVGVDALPAWVALETAASASWDRGYPGFAGLGFEASSS